MDPDERAAGLIACGVMPGMIGDLSRRLGDAQAELQGEREKIARGRRRSERAMADHAAGRITAFDIARMDFDEGDPGKVERLERRVASLRRDLEDASALVSLQREAPAVPLEAATRRANEAFVEVTRAKLAAPSAPRAPRPFSAGEEHTGPDCEVCAAGRELEAQRRAPAAESRSAYEVREAARRGGDAREITRLTHAEFR